MNGKVTLGYRTPVPNVDLEKHAERANSPVVTYYISDSELAKYRELKPPIRRASSYVPYKRKSAPGWGA